MRDKGKPDNRDRQYGIAETLTYDSLQAEGKLKENRRGFPSGFIAYTQQVIRKLKAEGSCIGITGVLLPSGYTDYLLQVRLDDWRGIVIFARK